VFHGLLVVPYSYEIIDDSLVNGEFLRPKRENKDAPQVSAAVRTWRSIIDENKARLKFYSDALEDDPSVEESLAYLRRAHAKAPPEKFISGLNTRAAPGPAA
jgi:hypothetical protein